MDADLAAIDISGTLQKQSWDDDVLPPVESLGQGPVVDAGPDAPELACATSSSTSSSGPTA